MIRQACLIASVLSMLVIPILPASAQAEAGGAFSGGGKATAVVPPGAGNIPSEPLTLSRRYRWVAANSLSPVRFAGYSISSAISTATNEPPAYGPHWDGWGKRIGLRAAGGATGSMLEASIGALWDEDPRYVRAAGQPFAKRLAHVAALTFLARDAHGRLMPAYARYISVPANSELSNAWRPDSETNAHHTLVRIPMSFLSRAIGNAFSEFWPDATKWLHRE